MESSLEQVNVKIEDAYMQAYKAILNMNDIQTKEEKIVTPARIVDLLQEKCKGTRDALKSLQAEKDELNKLLSSSNELLIKIEREISTDDKTRTKNYSALNELIANLEWEKVRKSISSKKLSHSNLIPMLTVIFDKVFTDDDIVSFLKQRNIAAIIETKTVKLNNAHFDKIKPQLEVIKNGDEMVDQVATINQFIKYQFEIRKKLLKQEKEKLDTRSQSISRELQIKVINDLITINNMQIDEDSILLAQKLEALISNYNQSINHYQNEDNVGIYYNQLMATIVTDRSLLIIEHSTKDDIDKPIGSNVVIEHTEIVPIPSKKKGFLKYFACCN